LIVLYRRKRNLLHPIANSPNSTWLVTSHLDTFDVSSESRRVRRALLFQHGGRRTSCSVHLYKFSRFYALTYTNLFVTSNEINVYFNKLVNNLHIITLYKLHNKLSCESLLSSLSCRARRVKCVEPCCLTSLTEPKCMGSCRVCRVVLFDKLDTAKNAWV